jgi:hypothetical protein
MSHHVLTAEFIHESNTFKMGLTQLRAFEVDLLKEGDVAIAERGDAPTELAASALPSKPRKKRSTASCSACTARWSPNSVRMAKANC